MWLQYPISIYWEEGNYAINGARTSIKQVMLNGTDPFLYRYLVKQPLPFPLGDVFIVNEVTMNVVDNSLGSC